MKLILVVTGIVLFIEGFPYLAFPAGVKKMTVEILKTDNRVLRIMGLIAMVAGLLLVWIGTGKGVLLD